MRKFFLFLAAIAILNLNFANATDNGSGDEIVPASRNLAIGVNSTSQRLTLNGALAIRQSARPVNISGTLQSQGWGRMYLNGTTNNLCFIDKDNLHYDLLDTGSGSGTSYINSLGDAYSDFSGTGIGDTVFLGFKAGGGETTVANIENTALGAYAGNGMTNSARNNTFVGFKVFNRSSFQGSYNTGLGSLIDTGSTTSSKNILIGYDIAKDGRSLIKDQNIIIGSETLYSGSQSSKSKNKNTLIGNQSGREFLNNGNVALGYYAGSSADFYTGSSTNGTYLGRRSGPTDQYSGTLLNNTIIGYYNNDANITNNNQNNNTLINVVISDSTAVNEVGIGYQDNQNQGWSYKRRGSTNNNIGIEIDPDLPFPKNAKFVINGSLAIRQSSRPNVITGQVKTQGWGRIYLNGTTNNLCFLDNGGSHYDLLDPGTSSISPAGANGSIQFKVLSSNGFAADPNNFHYDKVNKKFGLKTNNPLANLTVNGNFAGKAVLRTLVDTIPAGLDRPTIERSVYIINSVGPGGFGAPSGCSSTCLDLPDSQQIGNGRVAGQIIHIIRSGSNYDVKFDTYPGKMLLRGGTYTMGVGDSLTLMWVNGSTGWVELSRSNN